MVNERIRASGASQTIAPNGKVAEVGLTRLQFFQRGSAKPRNAAVDATNPAWPFEFS